MKDLLAEVHLKTEH